ncbi:MAG: hypothetical protein HY319_06695 [Armatimonadetes bacterium]|nr:hypothetical protein [Armatimonadota bacterium]
MVFAGRDVRLINPDSGGKWDFYGLVFATRDFVFDASGVNSGKTRRALSRC